MLPITVIESNHSLEDLFQGNFKDNSYVWETRDRTFFTNSNYIETFPLAINLFLKSCSIYELSKLLNGKTFLRIKLFNNRITLNILNIDNLIYNANDGTIPCEIDVDVYRFFTGINLEMFSNRRVELKYIIFTPHLSPEIININGITIYKKEGSFELF